MSLLSFAVLICLQGLGAYGQAWDGLRVTFDINPFNPYRYAPLPRTEADAKDLGWKEMDPGTSCDGLYFLGHRYIAYDDNLGADDTGVMLLFDVNGYIAGIQAGFREDLLPGYPTDDIIPPLVHEQDNNMYTITAYFVDPEIICTTGRSQEDFENQGTGDRLVLRDGDRLPVMPAAESDTADTLWVRGNCFPGMGQHYWYNISPEMSCDLMQPIFLMYNRGSLNAFGWSIQGLTASQRYEHPTPDGFHTVQGENAPDCILEKEVFSTMHIYMTDNPGANFC